MKMNRKKRESKLKKYDIERLTFNIPSELMKKFDIVCEGEFIYQRTEGFRIALLEFIKSREVNER